MINMKSAWIPALILLCGTWFPGTLPSPAAAREGEIIPFFTGTALSGEEVNLKAVAREGTVLIFFWNSYKTMAIREMAFLNEMERYYNLYGLHIIAIEGGGKDLDAVREELEKLKIIGIVPDYTVMPDPGGNLLVRYRVEEIPETFLIDRGGKILYHLSGFREEDAVNLDWKIKERLGLMPVPDERTAAPSPPAAATPADPLPRKRGVTVDPAQQLFEKHSYFGKYYFSRGEMKLALENYRRCLEIDPGATEIYLRLGEVYARLGDYEKAREAWEDVLRREPGNSEADVLIRRLIRGEF